MEIEAKYSELIRVPDQEALRVIRELATEDRRDIGDEVAQLIMQEKERRQKVNHAR
jgi:hypothetical protein